VSGTLRPRVVVFQGERILAVRELPADHEWHLGRRPDSPVPLNERSISRQHARLYCDGAGTHIEDLGTPNGTWVDGIPLQGTILLRDGQVIRLGQSTNPDPVLLRFEDPASRLLDALVRAPAEVKAPAPATTAGREPADAVGPAPAGEAPAGTSLAAAADLAAGAAHDRPDAGDGESGLGPEQAAGPRSTLPFLGLGTKAAVGASLAFIGVFWLLWALKSTQKPWQSVRVEPLRVQAGIRVSIRGSEVEPADSLKVFVEDREGRIEQLGLGQLVLVVPELPDTEAGTRAVKLRVERKGIVVLQQGLQYETAPHIQRIEPAEAAVGDTVALVGGGFVADAALVQVLVGGLKASVLRAAPERLEVRVPVVTRNGPVEAPVEVEIEGLKSVAVPLSVRPRNAPCFVLSFSARTVAARVFEVGHDFGPVLLVEAAARPGTPAEELPAPVRQAVEVLRAAFTPAQPPSHVRFEVQERGRSPVIVVTGLGASPRVVAALGPAVRSLLQERSPELRQPELALYWNAAILNELLELFVKQQPPRILPESEPAGALLRRLHQLSLEMGGSGCPAAGEIETLTEDDRRTLESAALRVPARFGDVAGVWAGSFENVQAAEQTSRVGLEMRLELEQDGTSLTGRLFLFEVRGPGIRWSPPPLAGLVGRVRLDAGTRVELRLTPVPPHDITQLTGTVTDDVMAGTYRTSRGKLGQFQLTYKATP
jgi:hypothetical protein